jgi:hypothetical protein
MVRHSGLMAEVRPLPQFGEVFTDIRGGDRALRVSFHPDTGVVVVSLWAGRHCRASCHLNANEAQHLVDVLGELTMPLKHAPTCGVAAQTGQSPALAG